MRQIPATPLSMKTVTYLACLCRRAFDVRESLYWYTVYCIMNNNMDCLKSFPFSKVGWFTHNLRLQKIPLNPFTILSQKIILILFFFFLKFKCEWIFLVVKVNYTQSSRPRNILYTKVFYNCENFKLGFKT